MVSAEDNFMLTNLLSLEEVKVVVFSMNGVGAPGPNGFGGHIYQHYWDIIRSDVFEATLNFF